MVRFDIEITNRVEQRLTTSVDSLRAAVIRKAHALALELEAYVKTRKLSGQVLHVRTGDLRRSIQSKVTVDGPRVEGSVFSDGSVPYADIHEFGGRTGPHDIIPVKAQALHFMMHGKEVFAKIVHHPGSKMPERSYLRSSLEEMAPRIESEMAAVLEERR